MAQKKFENLDLSNAFLFAMALEDAETCRLILELILDKPLPKVNVHVEHSVLFSTDFRSIRLDVYAADELEVGYDLEMQNRDKKKLPKRSRFYQAEIDAGALKPGEDFDDLKPSYIIFLCTFDPFDEKLYRYTFEERCLERDFPLGDGTRKIFLSTKGTNKEEVPAALVDFLHYVEDSSAEYAGKADDERIRRLHEKISKLKARRKWREQYMTFEELLRDSKQEGREEGREEERQHILRLVSRMAENGEVQDIPRLEQDPAFFERMCEKYCI